MTTKVVKGVRFTFGENEQQRYWLYEGKPCDIVVLQPKKASPPYWAIIAMRDNGNRPMTLNCATRNPDGGIIESGPLYVDEELPLDRWLEMLADWINAGNFSYLRRGGK